MTVTFGIKVFADVVKLRNPGEVLDLEWAPNPMTGALTREKRRKFEAHRHRGKGHMKTEAEVAVLCLQAEERPGLPAATRMWGRVTAWILP